MAGAKVPLTFRIYKGDQLLREERLSLSVIKLGKVPSAHLKLDDETVSRMHAIIEANGPGDVSIIDLGSTKGTFVNGQKVNKAKLQSGDTIVVGETRIELAISDDEPAEVSHRHAAHPPAESLASAPRAPLLSNPVAPPAARPPVPAVMPSVTPPAAYPPVPAVMPSVTPPAARMPVPAVMPSVTPPAAATPVPAVMPLVTPPAARMPVPAVMPSVTPPAAATPQAFPPPQTFIPPAATQAFLPPTASQEFAAPAAPQAVTPSAAPQEFAAPALRAYAPPVAAPAVRPFPGLPGVAPIFGTAMAPPVGFPQASAGAAEDHSGRRAVEVAAMMGDSVVGVKHCIDPRSGKVTAATWGLFAAGIVTLILSVAAFVVSVRVASFNKGGLDAWVQGDKDRGIAPRPAFAFRPQQLSTGYDWAAFGGILISLVSLTWGLARMTSERRSPYVRIGSAPDVEFATEDAPSPSFAMIAPQGDEFAFHFARGMEGEMIVGGQSTTLAELAAQGRTTICPIPPTTKIRVRAGRNTTFLISSVAQPRRQTFPLFAALDTLFAISLAGTAAVFGVILLLVWAYPPDASSINMEYASLEDTTTQTSSTAQDDPIPPEVHQPDDGADRSGGTGTAMQLPDGKMGTTKSDRVTGQYQMKKTQDDPTLAREQALDQARNAGFLGSEALNRGDVFASLTGNGDVSSGFDDANIYGGLLGSEPGEAAGGFGFGRSGFGAGAGGTGWGTVGTGRYGTIDHGAGTGPGYGVGGGRGGLRRHTAAVPPVLIGPPVSSGDLDKAIIRRYINRNIQKIQYCYDKQLLARPTLAGTVQTQFFITPAGIVAESRATGVDPEVASCVAGVLKDIEFPRPKGGGSVQVNYPFIFRSSGSSGSSGS